MKWNIRHIEETDSTNRWLREHDEADVVVADFQTAGRGCGTNSWESERGQNLTFSLRLQPASLPANRQFYISEAVSVALCQAVERYVEGRAAVKWPNDIYYGDRKLCGILIENRLQGSLIKDSIVGIGLNVNQQHFVSDAPNPVSLWQVLGCTVDRDELLFAFLDELELLWDGQEATTEAYRERLYRRTGTYWFRDADGLFRASIARVLADGRLVLHDEAGRERTYAFKEVQFIIDSTK